MGLGIVNDSEFERELSRTVSIVPEQVVNGEIRDKTKLGRDSNEVPNGLRELIGEESVINGRERAIELADQFGISKSSVSAYANGSTSTNSYNKQPNLNKLNLARLRVSNRARRTLLSALDHITEDKLSAADAPELATVAKSMSGIVKDMEPESPHNDPSGQGNSPTYIFYSPQVKREEHYDVINARE